VDAAEDDVFALSASGLLGETVRVSLDVGETYDFVALVVVSEDDAVVAETFSGDTDALVHRVVGQHKIIFKGT
jgi:hypothetical protein